MIGGKRRKIKVQQAEQQNYFTNEGISWKLDCRSLDSHLWVSRQDILGGSLHSVHRKELE